MFIFPQAKFCDDAKTSHKSMQSSNLTSRNLTSLGVTSNNSINNHFPTSGAKTSRNSQSAGREVRIFSLQKADSFYQDSVKTSSSSPKVKRQKTSASFDSHAAKHRGIPSFARDTFRSNSGFSDCSSDFSQSKGVWHRVLITSPPGEQSNRKRNRTSRNLVSSLHSATVGGSASFNNPGVGGRLELWMWRCVHQLQVLIVETPNNQKSNSNQEDGARVDYDPFNKRSSAIFLTSSCVSTPVPSYFNRSGHFMDYYEWVYFSQNCLEKCKYSLIPI
jgi:hypothetical protein